MPMPGFKDLKREKMLLALNPDVFGDAEITYIRKDGTQLDGIRVQIEDKRDVDLDVNTILRMTTIEVIIMKEDLLNVHPNTGDKLLWNGESYFYRNESEGAGDNSWWRVVFEREHLQTKGLNTTEST